MPKMKRSLQQLPQSLVICIVLKAALGRSVPPELGLIPQHDPPVVMGQPVSLIRMGQPLSPQPALGLPPLYPQPVPGQPGLIAYTPVHYGESPLMVIATAAPYIRMVSQPILEPSGGVLNQHFGPAPPSGGPMTQTEASPTAGNIPNLETQPRHDFTLSPTAEPFVPKKKYGHPARKSIYASVLHNSRSEGQYTEAKQHQGESSRGSNSRAKSLIYPNSPGEKEIDNDQHQEINTLSVCENIPKLDSWLPRGSLEQPKHHNIMNVDQEAQHSLNRYLKEYSEPMSKDLEISSFDAKILGPTSDVDKEKLKEKVTNKDEESNSTEDHPVEETKNKKTGIEIENPKRKKAKNPKSEKTSISPVVEKPLEKLKEIKELAEEEKEEETKSHQNREIHEGIDPGKEGKDKYMPDTSNFIEPETMKKDGLLGEEHISGKDTPLMD
ncbi:hypothetical protein VP01_527g3 [Puccinia sorghi]|uniref:Uncharacterized protein n=1 Tax=Puccinia sorghi TaxID=27349 RepID=A0A0L6UKE1_9BASI|nr:hypothetical protein VP01_527g3 [Puccinia sorghi]